VWVSAEARGIGVGGAFVAVVDVHPAGTPLMLELSLPANDQVFTLPAIVRWSRPGEGMGVQFIGVDVNVLLELNDYFGTLTAATSA
jgi:hypothetical protein